MSRRRLKETVFLDRYRVGVAFMERYNRRKASGDCTELHERLKLLRLEEMAQVEEAINAVTYEPHRKLLYYRYIKLLDYSEISKLVNSTPQNVERMHYHAIKRIKVPEDLEV